jgi:hypothetical protein
MRDFRDKQIFTGDTIAYCTRRSSQMDLIEATVVETGYDYLVVERDTERFSYNPETKTGQFVDITVKVRLRTPEYITVLGR